MAGSHEELIGANGFDGKFKRNLLNYYNYGFRSVEEYDDSTSKKVLNQDWDRLNRILDKYMEWSPAANGSRFITTDTELADENPMHRLYRFCKYMPSKPMYFLELLAALSSKIEYSESIEEIPLLQNSPAAWKRFDSRRLKVSDILALFSDDEDAFMAGARKAMSERLWGYSDLGLIESHQNKDKGDRYWFLPELTMGKILAAGKKVDHSFSAHFFEMLSFFSRTSMLGELGTFLKDRMQYDSKPHIRIRQDYFMQTLNDYTIVDLLEAMEQGKWCRISYRHGTAARSADILAFPIEIRASRTNGREFLIYYEPFRRSCTAVRLEFIDDIVLYEDTEIRRALIDTGYLHDEEEIDSDIRNTKTAISMAWGVSTQRTGRVEGNVISEPEPCRVRFRIQYDPEKEAYIRRRLIRERRNGKVTVHEQDGYIDYTVKVMDDREIVPFVRSFYGRLLFCEIDYPNRSLFSPDAENTARFLEDRDVYSILRDGSSWKVPEAVSQRIGKGEAASGHNALFNEVFSVYYYVIADVFLSMCREEQGFTEQSFKEIERKAFRKYADRLGTYTTALIREDLKNVLLTDNFVRLDEKKRYIPRFWLSGEEDADFYRDILPLSKFEIRWLKTVLSDPKALYFLSGEEWKAVTKVLNELTLAETPLPFERVVFFDESYFPEHHARQEKQAVYTALRALREKKSLKIRYLTRNKEMLEGTFQPISILYSKRINYFQVLLFSAEDDGFYAMNAGDIEEISLWKSYDQILAEQKYLAYRESRMRTVKVEFDDRMNMVDRILTEFSPWKKECTLDRESGIYTLTIHYQQEEEKELVIRLMGYGVSIYFPDEDDPIRKDILNRLQRQTELNRENRRILFRDREVAERSEESR